MKCPVDQTHLQKAIFQQLEVDYCPTCLGMWFDEDELRQAKDKKDEELQWLDVDIWQDKGQMKISKDGKLCPSCRLPMYAVMYGDSDIEIDLCNICRGVWLDHGEFRKIVKYLQKKKDWEVLHNYAHNLFQEGLEIFTGPESLREEVGDFLSVLKLLRYKFMARFPEITKIISELPK
jgi:uncharacterized protein